MRWWAFEFVLRKDKNFFFYCKKRTHVHTAGKKTTDMYVNANRNTWIHNLHYVSNARCCSLFLRIVQTLNRVYWGKCICIFTRKKAWKIVSNRQKERTPFEMEKGKYWASWRWIYNYNGNYELVELIVWTVYDHPFRWEYFISFHRIFLIPYTSNI